MAATKSDRGRAFSIFSGLKLKWRGAEIG